MHFDKVLFMQIKFTHCVIALIAIVAIIVSTSCTTVNSIERSAPVGSKDLVHTKKIITDGSLNRKVTIVSVNETLVSSNILKVQAELRNKTNAYQEFFYTFEWFDKHGMVVSSPSGGWRLSGIQPKETKAIIALAPAPATVDFRLKLKEQ